EHGGDGVLYGVRAEALAHVAELRRSPARGTDLGRAARSKIAALVAPERSATTLRRLLFGEPASPQGRGAGVAREPVPVKGPPRLRFEACRRARSPSTCRSSTPFRRTIAGGARASPNGPTSRGASRASSVTTSLACQPISASTICAGRKSWRNRPSSRATTVSTDSATTTTGLRENASSSGPWKPCARGVAPTFLT